MNGIRFDTLTIDGEREALREDFWQGDNRDKKQYKNPFHVVSERICKSTIFLRNFQLHFERELLFATIFSIN